MASKLDLVMRQSHRAGEKLFVDYAVRASRWSTATAGRYTKRPSSLPSWALPTTPTPRPLDAESPRLDRRTRADLCSPRGVPEIVVPDNLKAAVTRAHRYEPELNRTYADLAHHSGFAVLQREQPSHGIRQGRSGCPSGGTLDSGPAAAPHLLLTGEVNAAISPLLLALNAHPFKKLPGSRQQLFAALDARRSSPSLFSPTNMPSGNRFVSISITTWKSKATTTRCPTRWSKQQLDVRLSTHVVEMFAKGKRVASHQRSPTRGTTVPSRRICPSRTSAMLNGRPSG